MPPIAKLGCCSDHPGTLVGFVPDLPFCFAGFLITLTLVPKCLQSSSFAMLHQLLHCQPRIVAHRLARALQQSGVPALDPGDRRCEALNLRWRQVNLFDRTIIVGRAKTSSGTGRIIPINDDLSKVLASHRAWFVKRFGEPQPAHCVFPFGSPQPTEPHKPVTDISSGWDLVRSLAGVSCRLHDLRHTFCTRLAEAGVPESTMLALMGHMSRAMLERYSHIRMAAKREAVATITLRPIVANSEGVPVKVPVAVESPRIQ
jgi:hypothetical protein